MRTNFCQIPAIGSSSVQRNPLVLQNIGFQSAGGTFVQEIVCTQTFFYKTVLKVAV